MLPGMDWDELDYARLEVLRQRFLERTAGEADYWREEADLAAYDLTFAARIGWKWDAVLRELALRKWQPPTGVPVVDWGCGTGIALRRWLHHFGLQNASELVVSDRSARARSFARAAISRQLREQGFPLPEIRELTPEAAVAACAGAVLLVSHVINELDVAGRDRLLAAAQDAQAIIWVEPGAHAESRALISIRESLLGKFRPVAPCTHAQGCGLLNEANARHWCHHFGRPPAEAFMESHWARFGQWLGIDLRSLPYSFLVMERITRPETEALDPTWGRVLGHAREYKGYLKVLNCQAGAVEDLTLQQRDAKPLHKHLRKERYLTLYRWERQGERLMGGDALDHGTATDA